MLVSTEETARKALSMGEVSFSLLESTLGDVTRIEEAQKRLEDSVGLLDWAVKGLGKSVGETQRLFLLSLTLENYRSVLKRIRHDQYALIGGLRDAIKGHLSPELLPPDAILNILLQLSREGVQLIFPPREQDVHLYYDLIHVTVRPGISSGQLIMYLALPLPGLRLDVFSVHSFPRPVEETSSFIQTKISASYLFVSESRDMFMEVGSLDSCRTVRAGLYLCPASAGLHRRGHVQSCLSAAFFKEDKVEDICDEVVTDHFAPIVVRQGTRWIYSVPYPIEISVSCSGTPVAGITKPRETLDGVGVLRLASGCQATSQDFFIPPISSLEHQQAITVLPKPGWQDLKGMVDQDLRDEILHEDTRGSNEPGTTFVEASTLRERAWIRALLRSSVEQDYVECPAVVSWAIIISLWLVAMAGHGWWFFKFSSYRLWCSRRRNSGESASGDQGQDRVAIELPSRQPVQV